MGPSEERYVLWNYMLAEECLLSDCRDGTVQLIITPQTLARALEDAGEGGRPADEAETDFVAAVADVYRSRVLGNSQKLRALKSSSSPDVPFGTAFLALSVLAAFHMRTDDERSGRAFYPRLAAMLQCGLTRSLPEGFEGDAFLDLWEELAEWLKVHYRRRLAAPNLAEVRRFTAYPLAHIALRQVDLERLPQFFDAYGYEPGVRAPLDRLANDLFAASGPWRYLTEAGQRALQDPNRRPFIVGQVAHELQRWDGVRVDSSGARTASIEVWLDFRRRRAQLHLLARRPKGFPDVVEDGELAFESSQEGWYEPIPLGSEDGKLLEHGLRVGTHQADGRYWLQLRSSAALSLCPGEEYAGFISDRALRADTQCAVLCAEAVVDRVAPFLEAVTRGRVSPRRDDTIPKGWCLFTEIRPTNGCAPPPGFEQLGVESSIALVPEGGLRLGRRWSWLEDAPARLIVMGSHLGQMAEIDGQQASIGDDGLLEGSQLRAAGQHVIEIGNSLRQRVSVLPATVHPDCAVWPVDRYELLPVALPPGPWALVGERPGEYEKVVAPAEGALARPRFRVAWGLRADAGRGATALHLHDDYLLPPAEQPAEPAIAHRHSCAAPQSGLRWAEAIYQTGVRRPRLLCAHGCTSTGLLADWRETMESARSAKRRMRRARK